MTTPDTPRKIAFVDTAVADYQTLIAGLAPGIEVVLITAGDGLQQMADAVAGKVNLDAIYVISHGSTGSVTLGDSHIDVSNVAQQTQQWKSIGAALSEQGDILFYGCKVGAGEAGQALVEQLALATGADLAASDDLTGAGALGGNWDLEIASGDINAAPPLSSVALSNFNGLLALPNGTIQPESFNNSGSTSRSSADGNFLMTSPSPIIDYATSYATNVAVSNNPTFGSNSNILVNASGGLVSFQLTWLNVGEYVDVNTWDSLTLTGYLLGGGTVSGTILDVGGFTHSVILTNFVGKQITGFNIGFDAAAVSTCPADFNFDSFTISNALPLNIAPTITTSGGTSAFSEGAAPAVIDSLLTVADSDNSTLASATVSITGNFQSGQDTLAFTNNGSTMGNVSASYTAGTGVLTLTSAGASATLAQWQAALRSVTYSNSSDSPNTSARTVSYTVNDGIASSSAGTKAISVTGVNDAPTIGSLDSDTALFTEDGGAVLIDIGRNATVTDSDSADFDTGNVTVSIVANRVLDDELGVRNDGVSAGQIGTSGSAIKYGGVNIGSFTGGKWTNDLVITLNGSATPDAVQALIRSLTYNNINPDSPSTSDRTVRVTVNDGDGNSSAANLTVRVSAINDAPGVISSGGTTAFIEGAAPVVIDSGLTVVDSDNSTLASATVSVAGNFQSGQDTLAFFNSGGMGNISGIYTPGTGILALTSSGATATLAQWQAALRSVTYSNSSGSPNTSDRTVSFAVNDGTVTGWGGTQTVSVTGVNDPPTLSATGGSPTYTENAAAASLFSATAISTVDSGQSITGVTLTVSGLADGANEVLMVDGTAVSLTNGTSGTSTGGNTVGYSVSVTGATATVSLVKPAIAATWQTLVNGLAYEDMSEVPTTGNRVVTLTMIQDNGGTANGGVDTTSVSIASTVTVAAVNDEPFITAPGSITVTEDVSSALTGINFIDWDAGSASVTATLSVASGVLAATTAGGVSVAGSGTGSLTLTGSVANINAFIAGNGVSFTTASNATSNVTLTVEINDGGNSGAGGAKIASTTPTLAVTAVNDAPVNSLPATANVQQNASLTFNTANSNLISIADVDAAASSLQATLTGSQGVITLSGTTGLSFSTGDGTSDATMVFTGTLANINTALNGVVFTPTTGYNGAASLQVGTSDQGNTGTGGAKTDSDTIAITVNPNNPAVTSVSSTSPDDTYGIGDVITIAVGFSEAVHLSTGTLEVTLETGATNRTATYSHGSGTSTLYFDYTVQTGDNSADLDYVSTLALVANGDTVQSGSHANAILTLPAPGAAGSLAANQAIVVDGVRPTASIVVADTALRIGDTSLVTITFSEAVTGLTTADFTVANGNLSGLSTSDGGITWTATLTPTASITDPTNLISLDNTGLTDTARNTGTGTTSSNNYAIDTQRPMATIVVADTSLAIGEISLVTITFSEAVTGFTTADFTVANGALSGLATLDGGMTWTATLTPTADITDTSNIVTLANTGVSDAAGNTGTGTTDSNNYVIDTVPLPPPPPPPVLPPAESVDNDNDTVPDAIENQTLGLPPADGGVPVAGDGNGDGLKDSTQFEVTTATFQQSNASPGAPARYVSLVADSTDGNVNTVDTNAASITSFTQKAAPANLPEGVTMPLGLISFTANVGFAPAAADGSPVGLIETFSLFVDDTLGINGYWKQDSSGTWVNLASGVYDGKLTDLGSKLRLDFQIQDGGEFDADHTIDGIITDPGALAYLPPSLLDNAPHLPNDGFWF